MPSRFADALLAGKVGLGWCLSVLEMLDGEDGRMWATQHVRVMEQGEEGYLVRLELPRRVQNKSTAVL